MGDQDNRKECAGKQETALEPLREDYVWEIRITGKSVLGTRRRLLNESEDLNDPSCSCSCCHSSSTGITTHYGF
jgi:hypothetical protein